MQIFLLGFIGCGKSTIAKVLAQKLGLSFCDMDEMIVNSTEKSIIEIFKVDGEEAFRRYEWDCLKVCIGIKEVVVATGGGTACSEENLDLIKQNGISIYLQAAGQLLFDRIKDSRQERPLIAHLSDEELKPYITSKLKERAPYYLRADHVITVDKLTVEETVKEICDILNLA
jgi:shikimate kinase